MCIQHSDKIADVLLHPVGCYVSCKNQSAVIQAKVSSFRLHQDVLIFLNTSNFLTNIMKSAISLIENFILDGL